MVCTGSWWAKSRIRRLETKTTAGYTYCFWPGCHHTDEHWAPQCHSFGLPDDERSRNAVCCSLQCAIPEEALKSIPLPGDPLLRGIGPSVHPFLMKLTSARHMYAVLRESTFRAPLITSELSKTSKDRKLELGSPSGSFLTTSKFGHDENGDSVSNLIHTGPLFLLVVGAVSLILKLGMMLDWDSSGGYVIAAVKGRGLSGGHSSADGPGNGLDCCFPGEESPRIIII